MKETELKPCPFCGGKAKINVSQSGFHGQNFEGNKCHARGKPIKTEPIKLYADHSHIEIGSFYATEFWLGSGRGSMKATLTFEPYVDDAIEAWNRRADK